MIKVYIKKIIIPKIKQRKKLNLQNLKLLALKILKVEAKPKSRSGWKERAPLNAEISITLVDNAYIRKLNAKYRGKNTPTDVIAFAISIPEKSSPRRACSAVFPINRDICGDFLGDIYISIEQAGMQVQKGETLQIELKRLLIHGVLHILGYKHSRKMKTREEYYLKWAVGL